MKSRQKTFHIETFGCQMNVNDSEKVAGLLRADGYEPAASARSADFVFINTCAVREKATQKLYSSLGRLRQQRRDDAFRVGVGGCVAQLHGAEIRERAPEVDVLIGPGALSRLPELLRGNLSDGEARVDLGRGGFEVAPQLVAHGNPYRAYVTAIEGCNHVCSFCVVPRTRGVEVCRPLPEIVTEVEAVAARGIPEVMLLGQTINAYSHEGSDFADMLTAVAGVAGIERVRFTTSHPSHMTPAMATKLGRIAKLCPYIHLPVQSGSDAVLASMRRGYTRGQYLETIAALREAIPGLALSSDAIVGYPGESERDFEATVSLVEEAAFDGLFVFAYSPRPGTSALRLPDDVAETAKLRRLQVLNDLQQRRQEDRNRARVGTHDSVLFEESKPPGRLSGRTPQFRIVHVDADVALLGSVARVLITAAGPNSLQGRLLDTVH